MRLPQPEDITIQASFILYVKDQELSREFYQAVLDKQPSLHVPGMTEFSITDNCKLGLMPESGIKRLIGASLPDPSLAHGIPRAEIYLFMEDVSAPFKRALEEGAKVISALQDRDWGHKVCYLLDPDGHVIALAETGSMS